jgi:hypothetical protein
VLYFGDDSSCSSCGTKQQDAEHNPFLQLADVMLGVCADFVKWSFTGKPVAARLRKMFPIVFGRLRSVYYYDEFTTGFVIASCGPAPSWFSHMPRLVPTITVSWRP